MDDLGSGLYLSEFQGGLYPGGSNVPPAAHAAEGIARANGLQPLDTAGNPSAAGRIVLLSIGMSNVTQEFCSASAEEPCDPWTFMGQAAIHPDVNHATLVLANGAYAAQVTETWDAPTDLNYDRVRDYVLAPKGVTESQVQVVWVKQANRLPTSSLPNADADAYLLEAGLGDVARAVKTRYSNCQIMFVSSRIYAGYASTALNPEPFAYESAFSVKWLVEAQIEQMAGGGADPIAGNLNHQTVAPWLAWGPYLWADGLTPRSDGLIWECTDFADDGTHPAMSGEQKVGTMLLEFMLDSPYSAPWFRVASTPELIPATSAWSLIVTGSLVLVAGTLIARRASVGARMSQRFDRA